MPEATTRRFLLALTLVMAALFCVPQTAPGKALDPSQFAQSELWEPQPERVRVELVRIPGRHLADFAIVTENASGRTKWLSRDPLGEAGGLNLYGFVNNDPINGVDYLGMATIIVPGGGGGGSPGWEQPAISPLHTLLADAAIESNAFKQQLARDLASDIFTEASRRFSTMVRKDPYEWSLTKETWIPTADITADSLAELDKVIASVGLQGWGADAARASFRGELSNLQHWGSLNATDPYGWRAELGAVATGAERALLYTAAAPVWDSLELITAFDVLSWDYTDDRKMAGASLAMSMIPFVVSPGAGNMRRVLVVGESDAFEYSIKLARQNPNIQVTGTSLGKVRPTGSLPSNLTIRTGVDATDLGRHFSAGSFDDIVFNAPRAANPDGWIPETATLIDNVLGSARSVLVSGGAMRFSSSARMPGFNQLYSHYKSGISTQGGFLDDAIFGVPYTPLQNNGQNLNTFVGSMYWFTYR